MTGFAIQRLNEVPSPDDVLMEGRFATRHYYTLNQAFVSRKASYYLKLVIERIARTRKLPERIPTFPYAYPLFNHPNLREVTIYFVMLCYTLLMKKDQELLEYSLSLERGTCAARLARCRALSGDKIRE